MSNDQLRRALRDVDCPAGKDEPKDPAEELQSWTRTSRPEDARA